MPKGMLTVVASLDISQFWPASKGTSSSDGDTVHLKVDPTTSFLFSSSPGKKPKIVKDFVGSYVVDHKTKKKLITSKSEIKIRLQGIDTPELHLPVIGAGPWNPAKVPLRAEYRQPFGAGAANALHAHLQTLLTGGGTVLHATFMTQVDNPAQAIDSHGRFVGDIIVGTAGSKSINTWLVENGWAYPLFYDSMTVPELNALVTAWKAGKTLAARPGKAIEKPLQPFNPKASTSTTPNCPIAENSITRKFFGARPRSGPRSPARSPARTCWPWKRKDRKANPTSPILWPISSRISTISNPKTAFPSGRKSALKVKPTSTLLTSSSKKMRRNSSTRRGNPVTKFT